MNTKKIFNRAAVKTPNIFCVRIFFLDRVKACRILRKI